MKKSILFLILALVPAAFAQEPPTTTQPPTQNATPPPTFDSILAEQAELNRALTAQIQERVELLKAFIEKYPKSTQRNKAQIAIVQTYAIAGDGELRAGNLAKALIQFRAGLTAAPEPMPDAVFQQLIWNMPVVVNNYGHRLDAIKLMREFEDKFWAEPNRLIEISAFYAGVEDAPDALRVLERTRELAPKDSRVRSSLGSVRIMGFEFEEAEKEFKAAVELDPKAEFVYTSLGHLTRAKGDYQAAFDYYKKQIEVTPNDAQAYGGVVIASLALGKEAEAAAALAKTLELNPNDFRFFTQLAYWYALNRNFGQATEAVEAALRLEPRYPWARIIRSHIYLSQEQYAAAEKEMHAAKQYANFPSLMFEYGRVFARAGMFDDALEMWRSVLEVTPMDDFRVTVGGAFALAGKGINELIERERRAAIFFKEPLSNPSEFQIAERLMRFDAHYNTLAKRPEYSLIPRYLDLPPAEQTETAATDAPRIPLYNPDYILYENFKTKHASLRIDNDVSDLNLLDDDRRLFRLIWLANKLTEVSLKPDLAIGAAQRANELLDAGPLPENAVRDIAGQFSKEQQLAIVKARAEDALGWALFRNNQFEPSLKYFKSAVERSPLPKERKELYWRYAVATEAAGKEAEALELYIKGFDRTAQVAALRLAVIENLYKKQNGGSLDGLLEKMAAVDNR